MRHTLHLACAALLLAATAGAHAQITSPDALVAKPPRNPADRHASAAGTHADTVQWLNAYTAPTPKGDKAALLIDARFETLLADNLRAPQSMWSTGMPLAQAAAQFLAGPGSVNRVDNRYIVVNGCITDPDTHACTQRGLLWIDTAQQLPMLAFAALRWTEQSKTPTEANAPFNLWIFPSRPLGPAELPAALTHALNDLVAATCPAPAITNVLLIDPSGVPHVLGTLAAGITPAPCKPAEGITP